MLNTGSPLPWWKRKKTLIIAGVLLAYFLLVFIVLHKSGLIKTYSGHIIAVAYLSGPEELEFFLLDNSIVQRSQPSGKLIAKYPYSTEEPFFRDCDLPDYPFEKLNNLVPGNDRKHFYLVNFKFHIFDREPSFEKVFSVAKINYQPLTHSLSFKELMSGKMNDDNLSRSDTPFAFDSTEQVLFCMDHFKILENGTYRAIEFPSPDIPGTGLIHIGGALIDDTRVALLYRDYVGKHDYLSIYHFERDSKNKVRFLPETTKFALGPSIQTLHHDFEWFNPIAVSPSKNQLAFFANLPVDEDKVSTDFLKNARNDESFKGTYEEVGCSGLNLVAYDINKNTLVRKIRITDEDCALQFPQVAWCPDPKRNLVAACTNIEYWRYENHKNPFEPRTLIVDMDSGKILKSWRWKNKLMRSRVDSDIFYTCNTIPVKSIRWSPDGSKVGFLTVDGQLFIYDVDKDTTTCVSEDRDYFDFYWVE